jgi:hypothetical protein
MAVAVAVASVPAAVRRVTATARGAGASLCEPVWGQIGVTVNQTVQTLDGERILPGEHSLHVGAQMRTKLICCAGVCVADVYI